MRCADCPDLGDTGTRKRAVCCLRDGAERVAAAIGGNPDAIAAQLGMIVAEPLTAADLKPSDTNAAMVAARLREVVPPGTPLNNRAQRRRAAARYGKALT